MPYISLNPATNKILKTYTSWDTHRLAESLEKSRLTQEVWRQSSFEQRATLMHRAANLLLEKRDELALLITQEMGKPIKEARSEVEKCAVGCEYYAIHAAHFLQDEPIESDAGESYVSYPPLGTVLAIMPWNFPLWQVFRFAAPALMAGNAGVLKHASNVPQCALAIENIFRESGFPDGLFTTLMIDVDLVNDVIASHSVHAVTLTGSEPAGRKVAAAAGLHLKKCVLELGGSDAFVVLHDADIEYASQVAAASRFLNCGQSCIAAKRFILVPEIADEFVALFKQKVSALKTGDPMDESTQVGPMARLDLRDEMHRQITDSIAQGAEPVIGCKPLEGDGAFYAPSILDHVTAKTRAYHEELFGPAAIIIRAQDEMDALHIANDTKFGLGSSLWSKDTTRAEKLSRELHAGCTFINGMVKSDPRLPFGGIKASGFGRELSYHGIREFVNAKTVWIK
ncbi:NAD-dependent succinate-semialdehyde dehydrogenase [Sulfurirhabdus autotrophica]|uniref:Succinate-semialdehyde dehydrogenase/glutarate-semialdehyde dehydrogenase n=1 Tax=Sulfurirhabdus autotrophica TaxID=1706046 RepID=A0A4V2W1I1_9PROT|nr:NAD-dependent succinate-semialdehyde dehydrogenase [Sulfurirhabdus autotrophica]TCV84339.1 succinate-semialdehyde dehydrogenase/glutarate-semialdehyde dehydrogenase [Sulfurirhabdus autotrophica]